MIHAIFSFNKTKNSRLSRTYSEKFKHERSQVSAKIMNEILERSKDFCNIFSISEKDLFNVSSNKEKQYSIVYRKYISLFFVIIQDYDDNDLLALGTLNLLVECFDAVFIDAKEIDIIMNFELSNFIIDEIIVAGEIQEISFEFVREAINFQQRNVALEKDNNQESFIDKIRNTTKRLSK